MLPFDTLAGLLEAAAAAYPSLGFHSFPTGERLTAPELLRRSHQVAARLRERGVQPGQLVGVLLPNSMDLLAINFGVFRSGAVLAPLAVPTGMQNVEAALTRLQHIVTSSGIRHLVIGPELADLVEQSGVTLDVVTPEGLISGDAAPPEVSVAPGDLALVQYTSGSTASPKGVALTHRGVVAGLRAMVLGARLTEDDVYALWLPLSHDMGLIGTIAIVAAGADVHFSTPAAFIKRPGEWLEHFARVRATLYCGPNFSYQYMLDGVDEDLLQRLDLSAWRLAVSGSETVDPLVVERFTACFGRAGFKPQAMFPVYGLAEATLGVSFPELGELPVVEWIDRAALAGRGEVEPAPRADARARGVVAVGRALPGIEVRIMAQDSVLAERGVGEIEVRGAPVMSGYYLDPERTREAFHEGWLRTGDLGYLSGGRLFVTGRIKEMMKLRGENYFPEDVEALVRPLPGVYRQRCVALVITDGPAERMAVLVETGLGDSDALRRLGAEVKRRLAGRLDVDAVDVYLLEPRSILRTTSGKYQRLAMREQIATGALQPSLRGVY